MSDLTPAVPAVTPAVLSGTNARSRDESPIWDGVPVQLGHLTICLCETIGEISLNEPAYADCTDAIGRT